MRPLIGLFQRIAPKWDSSKVDLAKTYTNEYHRLPIERKAEA